MPSDSKVAATTDAAKIVTLIFIAEKDIRIKTPSVQNTSETVTFQLLTELLFFS